MCSFKLFGLTSLILIHALLLGASESEKNSAQHVSNNFNASNMLIQNNVIPHRDLNAFVTHTKATSKSADNVETSYQHNNIAHTDEYMIRSQRRCLEKRNLISCLKYKASKIVWMLATNKLGYFPNEYSRALVEDERRIRVIQLGEPADIVVFNDARSLVGTPMKW